MQTTLNEIRKHQPCADGWEKLLTYLGKTKADDEPLSLVTIIDSNGLDDAIWCLRAVAGRDREIRLFAVWCARQVQHLLKDQRSLDAIDVAERYANGQATKDELATAAEDARFTVCDAAMDAAWYAAYAAKYDAWAAYYAAAEARSAARYAARDAADAAGEAAGAEREMGIRQEAKLRRICEKFSGVIQI